MPNIKYLDGETIEADEGQTILEAAICAKVNHMAECGGHGRCTTCRVQIVDGLGSIGERTPEEQVIVDRKGWSEDIRLSCQTKVNTDLMIRPLVSHRSDLFTFNLTEADRPVGQEQQLAVMFCDLRNFTSISEGMLPHDVMYIVNSYATECSEAILQNDGYIDKYMGDGIMAVFGLSDTDAERVCKNAVRAALNIQNTAERLTEKLGEEFGLTFRIGVGIHYGPCVVGLVGHPSRQSFSLLGDTVNAASRIESMTKEFDTNLLISETVFENAPEAFTVNSPEAIRLRGKDTAVKLYPVEGMAKRDALMLVQQSLSEILPHRKEVGAHFYKVLFKSFPEYRPLFPKDMEAQSVSLMNMLESTVIGACRPGDMLSGLRELGKRHVDYGIVRKVDFDRVGECLIKSLSDFLGDRFTPELRESWAEIYDLVAGAVHQGMHSGVMKRTKS